MLREQELLANAIRDHIAQATTANHKKYMIELSNRSYDDAERNNEEWNEADETLKYYVEQGFLLISILAEQLGLPLLRKEIADQRKRFAGKMSKTEPSVFDIVNDCPALMCLRRYNNALTAMMDTKALTGLDVFETILWRTPAIIDRSPNTEPETETQVKEQVFEILKLAFRDATREVPFKKTFQTYKGDLAVPKLKAVAEYKFADKKSDVAHLMSGIYDDMKGYSGHYEYQNFYAVIYMTGPFYDQKDFDNEFQLVKADLRWRPIALVGGGGRKTRSRKIAVPRALGP